MSIDENGRNEYMVSWAAQLTQQLGYQVDPQPHVIAAALINDKKHRNYLTASCLIFGLGYVSHKDYVERASVAIKKWHEENGCADVDPVTLAEYVTYYCAEVEEYPGVA